MTQVLKPNKAETAKALGTTREFVSLAAFCSCNSAKAAAKRSELIKPEKTF